MKKKTRYVNQKEFTLKDLTGSWTDGDTIYEFKDNRVTEVDAEDPEDKEYGTFQVIDDLLILTFDGDDDTYHYEIEGDRLILSDEYATDVYKRVKTSHPLEVGDEDSAKDDSTVYSFSGVFSGMIQNTEATAHLNQMDNALKGKIDASGYIYMLDGSINGDQASGEITDTTNGTAIPFHASINNDQLLLKLELTNPQTMQTSLVSISFKRGMDDNLNSIKDSESDPIEQLEPRLFGSWRKTDSFSGDEVGLVIDYWLYINSDGTYRYGDSKAVGGGYGFDATLEGGDDASIGRWRTKNGIIEIMQHGTNMWIQFARYYIQGTTLMLTAGDGTREIWNRVS